MTSVPWGCLSCLVAPGRGLAPRPKSAPEPGIWELDPAVWARAGKWGAPNSAAKVAARSQNITPDLERERNNHINESPRHRVTVHGRNLLAT